MRPHHTPSSFHKTPVTGLVAQRRVALLYGWVLGGVAITLVFLPVAMAAGDPALAFGAALADWYNQDAFILVLAGLFAWAMYLGPVWFAMRLWIGRQGDRALGAAPATLPVWLAVWVFFVAVQVWIAGEDGLTPPPGVLAQIPAPFDALFNAILLAQMGGVTVMFAVYRRLRPRDGRDDPQGPVVSHR